MNIFLVEDEHWALAELVELFRKYEPQHVIRAFDNGEDALAAARSEAPQLVLTDVTMPGLDGFELCKALRRLNPDVQCVILSVHDQFAYVQQGVRLGAVDYLLKPVRREALYSTVDRALRAIDAARARKEQLIGWKMTQLLLASGHWDHEIAEWLYRRKYAMAVLLLGNWGAGAGWKETEAADPEMKRELECGAVRGEDIHIVDIDAQRKAILIHVRSGAAQAEIAYRLSGLYKRLKNSGLLVHLGYDFKGENEAANRRFELLNRRIADHMRLGGPTFIPPGLKAADVDIGGVWDLVRLLEPAYKKGELRQGRAALRKITEELRRRNVTIRQLQLFVNDMFYSLKYKLNASRTDFALTQQENVDIPATFTAYDELFEWLSAKIERLFRDHEPEQLKPRELVPKIMQWVRGNYQGDISLRQFAADHHVSLGYLSRIFKEQTGETFSSYIVRFRIEKAKELIDAGVDSLSELGSLVGYEDPKHFRHLFKKLVGVPPHAYSKRAANRK